ncbi:MAG: OB-fold nucleic acid binding domain-containing protein, partial [Eubacteriales bacterium]
TISDGTNSLYCYRLAGGEELKVGDFILVTGKPSAYNGKGQMAQGATYVLNGEIVPAEDTGKTFVSQALDAAGALDSGNSTTNEWIVVGAVTGYTYDSAKTKQQFSLSDGVKQILVYGANWEGIADLQNGTILAVKGILKNYNGTLEVMNPEIYANLTSIADAAAAGIAGTGAEGTVIYGKITSIDTAYSASFDNITVTISDGTNSIQCYRLKGGADLEVGDCILVTGTPSAYNGDAQMGAGATYVVNGEIVPPDEDTRDTYDAATNNTVTYNFSETVTKASTTAYTVEQASTVFEESCNLQKVPLEVSTVTVVYPGNGTATGFIKLGKSGAGGTITLKFDRAVASVQIKCHDYYTSSDTNPENFTTLAVNGSDGQVVPYTADGTPDVLTFNLSESSKEVTISSGKNAGTNYRVFIYEIVIVFA